MNIYVGITDYHWYEQLSHSNVDEVNFWSPGATSFNVLKPNELFLFKLHSPNNFIVGGGFFVRYTQLPSSLVWSVFGTKNGTKSYEEFVARIEKYRGRNSISSLTQVGCTVLTDPFWFERADWLPVPEWSSSIVRGKTYSTLTEVGRKLYADVQERIQRVVPADSIPEQERYREGIVKHRLGQGAFRVEVTEAYHRRCAITGEKTLPVLEAAHIVPYSENGQHVVNNGILLKSDFHTLFDEGYITITDDYKIEVSRRLNEDFGNGKDYYKHHGEKLLILPEKEIQRPSREFIEWHNEHVYKG